MYQEYFHYRALDYKYAQVYGPYRRTLTDMKNYVCLDQNYLLKAT